MRWLRYLFMGLLCLITSVQPGGVLAEQSETLTGEFTQKRFLQGFDEPLVSTGVFAFNPALGFAWITQSPFPSKLVITKDAVFQEVNGAVMELQGGSLIASQVSRLLIPVLANDHTAMAQDFIIQKLAQNLDGTDWTYELQPKSDGLKTFIKKLVAAGGAYTDRIEVHKPEGDRDEILLSGQQNISKIPSNIQTYFKLAEE